MGVDGALKKPTSSIKNFDFFQAPEERHLVGASTSKEIHAASEPKRLEVPDQLCANGRADL